MLPSTGTWPWYGSHAVAATVGIALVGSSGARTDVQPPAHGADRQRTRIVTDRMRTLAEGGHATCQHFSLHARHIGVRAWDPFVADARPSASPIRAPEFS